MPAVPHPAAPSRGAPCVALPAVPCLVDPCRTTPRHASGAWTSHVRAYPASPGRALPAIPCHQSSQDLEQPEAQASRILRVRPPFSNAHLHTHTGDQVQHIIRTQHPSVEPDPQIC